MDEVARRVLGTLRAVHHPVTGRLAGGRLRTVCGHCDTGDPYVTVSMDWPCPTLTAAEAAVVGAPVDVHVHAVTVRWRPTTPPSDEWVREVRLLT